MLLTYVGGETQRRSIPPRHADLKVFTAEVTTEGMELPEWFLLLGESHWLLGFLPK